MLVIVPIAAGWIVTKPVPVGLISTLAFTPLFKKFPVFKIELNTPAPINEGWATVIIPAGIPSASA